MAARTIAIISDTHLPRGRRRLPAACVERLAAADLIVHAGDLSTRTVLDGLCGLGEVAAVHGNVDDTEVRTRLPERLELTVEGVRIAVIHDAGPAPGRLKRLRRSFPGADVVIFGHSHIPVIEQDPLSGFQIVNPGSPTDKRRQPNHTMGLAQVADGAVTCEIVVLD